MLILVLGIVTTFSSCSKDNDESTPIKNSLYLTPEKLEFKQDGTGLYNDFNVICNESWKVISSEAWIHLDQTSGIGDTKISVTIDANTTSLKRTGKITIQSPSFTKSVTVEQAANPKEEGVLEVTKNGDVYTAEGMNFVFHAITGSVVLQSIVHSPEYKNIVVPSYIKYNGKKEEVHMIADKAFFNPDKSQKNITYVETVTLPNTIMIMGENVFQSCKTLLSVNIPNQIEYIPDGTFAGCTKLKEVDIPSNIRWIGNNAFYGCQSIKTITLHADIYNIYGSAFAYCTSLESINIPAWTELGDNVFDGCIKLTTVTIDSNSEYYTSIDNNIYSKDMKTLLTCLPSKQSIDLPNSVEKIGDGAFSTCEFITSLNIIEGVTDIGNSAFSECTSLQSITLPSTLKTIGDGVFYGCFELSLVVCKAVDVPNCEDSYIFEHAETESGTLYVPSESITKYRSSEIWNVWNTIASIEEK